MKLTKVIYVASAYTAKEYRSVYDKVAIEGYRFLAVTKCIGKLQDKYPYYFVGPITQSHLTAPFMTRDTTAFKAWAQRDLSVIAVCHELWIYADEEGAWKQSTGVREEIKFCKKRKIPIRMINPVNYRVVARKNDNLLYETII